MPIPVFIASESELLAIKNAAGPLKLLGYKKYGDNSEEEVLGEIATYNSNYIFGCSFQET